MTTSETSEDSPVSTLLHVQVARGAPESVALGEAGLPVGAVAEAVEEAARQRAEATRTRSAELARSVVVRAEQEVRELFGQDLDDSARNERAREIVARAEREVSQILAHAAADADLTEVRASHRAAELRTSAQELVSAELEPSVEHVPAPWHPTEASDSSLEQGPTPRHPTEVPDSSVQEVPRPLHSTDVPEFSETDVRVPPAALVELSDINAAPHMSLVGRPLASDPGRLRVRLEGGMTLATMLGFEQAVSRLPGVGSASIRPQPNDIAVLDIASSDTSVVWPLLACLPGLQLAEQP